MAREFFKNLPDTSTPLNASRLNGLLNGNEAMGSIVVDDIRSKNLVNEIITGYTLNGSGGVSATSTKFVTGFMEVEGGKTYTSQGFKGANGVENNYKDWYTADKTFISNTNDKTATAPANAKFCRMNGVISTSSNMQLELGSTATNYSEYKKLDTDIYSFDTNLTYNSASSQSFQNAILKNAKLVICNFHSTDGNWDIQTQHLTSGTSFTSMQTSTNWYVASNFDSTLGKITFLTKSDNSNFVLNKITVVK